MARLIEARQMMDEVGRLQTLAQERRRGPTEPFLCSVLILLCPVCAPRPVTQSELVL